MKIRAARPEDNDAVWRIFEEVVSGGDTYVFRPDMSREDAIHVWIEQPRATYVAERGGDIVGTYYLKTNQPGRGAHVCNAGYMVDANVRGEGIGTAMCRHSLDEARRLGYRAMQFNLVVSTNTGAVRLWERLGFDIVGTIPNAFDHREEGLVDAHVMYRWLDEGLDGAA